VTRLCGNGLKILLLVRLSPIMPFNAINYICGVTSVSLRDYALALIAILPGTTLYVFLGASAGSLTSSSSMNNDATVTIVVVVVGVLFGIAAVYASAKYARMELNRLLEERRSDSETITDEAPGTSAHPTGGASDVVSASINDENVE
jgi:uncharacterized membrane protein YdjX (TVP38/TMEM64 family)